MPAKDNGEAPSGGPDYRQAATDALEMVDWCIGYLVGSRKEKIAQQLAENRRHIRKLLREPEEPVPTTKG